jgi:hypothetical protein
MDTKERADLIAKYASGYDEVIRALGGFPAENLDAHPIPDKWSAREIVHHLGDCESIAAIRLRKLIVEEHPTIEGFDQDAFAQKLKYNERDMAPALDAFRSARAVTAQLLAILSDEEWKRKAIHTESGPYSVEKWLRIYADHAHNHAVQIQRLKDALS